MLRLDFRRKVITLLILSLATSFSYGQNDTTDILFFGMYTRNQVYIDAVNPSDRYISFFDKQLEKVGLTEKYYEVVVSENRITSKGDTLFIDLTSNLDNVDSTNTRVKRFLTYKRWQPSHLEPHERIKYRIMLRKSQLRQIKTIVMKVEGNNETTRVVVPQKKVARFHLKRGKMFL